MNKAHILLRDTVSPYGPVNIMQAHMPDTRFSRHSHDGFGIGVITAGALSFCYRGENLTAFKGLVNTVNPDEPHDGRPAAAYGWAYRMLYFSEAVFRNAFHDISGKTKTPYILNGVINDPKLAGEIFRFTELTASTHETLKADSAFCILMSSVMAHIDKKPQESRTYRLGGKLRKVKDCINERINENITGKELAETAGLSLYHFIRSFKADTGLTPHEYSSVRRAIYARNLLLKGMTPAEAASEAGYSDQSHMTRRFRQFFGATPKIFSKNIL